MPVSTSGDPRQVSLFPQARPPQAEPTPVVWVEPGPQTVRRRILDFIRSVINLTQRPGPHYIKVVGLIERRIDLWGGAAVLAGTRIPIFAIEDAFQDRGMEAVLESYPTLTKGDVYFALAYSMVDAGVDADRRTYLNLIPPEFRD